MLADIEAALRDLRARGEFYVDTQGGIHVVKDPFINRHVLPLASFRAESDGLFSVFSGLPARATTYCAGNSAKRHEVMRNALIYSTVLQSGDWLALGPACVFRVPEKILGRAPQTGEEQLQNLLATADVGDIVSLGRLTAPSVNLSVSRVHTTVEILQKRTGDQGTLHMMILVVPGLPSKEVILVGPNEAELVEVKSQRTIHAGMKVTLGALGNITVPYQEGSIEEVSQSISGLLATGDRGKANFLLTCIPQRDRLEYSKLKARRARQSIESPDLALKVNLLESKICRSLALIKAGKFGEAATMFKNPDTLQLVGYCFQHKSEWELPEISVEAIRRNLQCVTTNSWFWRDRKLVNPSFGKLRRGVEPQNDSERDLLSRWEKELALIYAEEYTHALQDLLQSNVSRKAVLFPSWDSETDVAVFFHEQGVTLSYDFVQGRYPERNKGLRIVLGYQVQADQLAFREALHQTEIGQRLYIGKATPKQEPHKPGFSIPERYFPEVEVDDERSRSEARAELAPIEAVIVRKPDGSYMMYPYLATGVCRVAVPDASGYYSKLSAPVILEPNTPFYIGRAFKFVLE